MRKLDCNDIDKKQKKTKKKLGPDSPKPDVNLVVEKPLKMSIRFTAANNEHDEFATDDYQWPSQLELDFMNPVRDLQISVYYKDCFGNYLPYALSNGLLNERVIVGDSELKYKIKGLVKKIEYFVQE